MTEKIAIVGSREGVSEEIVGIYLRGYIGIEGLSFISGGAEGVDKFAENFAKKHKIPIEVIRPIPPITKVGFLYRNIEIITKADRILAFWNGHSSGTKFVINYAKSRGKKVTIIQI